jgi:hypothetical protein
MSEALIDWKNELLAVGNIVQDGDETVTAEEAHRRFLRYIEMLDSLTGREGYEYALAVMQSVQAVHDYGAYQTTGHTLWRFGEDAYCQAILHELPRLIQTLPDWAGEFLVRIANGAGTENESTIHRFNDLLSKLDRKNRSIIEQFIAEQEEDGWLEDQVGVLGNDA